MTVERIAQVCHEANRAYCATLEDNSQPSWADAPDWQRNSAINGVRLHIANPDMPDSASHDAWMREKVDTGWVYGETKDAKAKTHPCIVPYEELPEEQKRKDRLFSAIVKALA